MASEESDQNPLLGAVSLSSEQGEAGEACRTRTPAAFSWRGTVGLRRIRPQKQQIKSPLKPFSNHLISQFTIFTFIIILVLFLAWTIWVPAPSEDQETRFENNCFEQVGNNGSTDVGYQPNYDTEIEKLEAVTIHYGPGMNKSSEPPSSKCPLVKGRRILINYASNCCKASQALNCITGLETGGFDVCVSFTEKSLDPGFRARNEKILSVKTGAGLWVWKPYIIYKTLLAMEDDDTLLYSDSGSKFVSDMNQGHFCLQRKLNQDIVLFAYEQPERVFSKGDAFLLLGCEIEREECANSNQFLGSPVLLRKTLRSLQFVGQWLTYAQDFRILSNENSTLVKDSKDFVANRNDQTVLSILAKKWKIVPWPDPSQWGENEFGQSLRHRPEFVTISKTYMDLTRQKW